MGAVFIVDAQAVHAGTDDDFVVVVVGAAFAAAAAATTSVTAGGAVDVDIDFGLVFGKRNVNICFAPTVSVLPR
jgi:hypothetical protein